MPNKELITSSCVAFNKAIVTSLKQNERVSLGLALLAFDHRITAEHTVDLQITVLTYLITLLERKNG